MPPRKKAKRAHSTTPQAETAQSSADTPGSTDSVEKSEADYDLLTDPWTDEQETALLKAIIKWKPVGGYYTRRGAQCEDNGANSFDRIPLGVHKHFRMVAISEFLKNQGYGPANGEHLTIPGIWKKLGTLYNLEALNEREDSAIVDSNEDEEGIIERYCPFELPYDEYGDLMFERRLATEGSLSPVMSRHADSRRGSTVADTDEPRSSPAPSRGRKSTRGTRQTARETRSTRLHVEINNGSQKTSDEDILSDEEDTGGNEEDEEEGEEGSDEKESGDEEDGPDDEKGSRSTRAQTFRTRQKDAKPSTNTGTRRTGRRR
ncbi:hypothetical protein N7466_011250 [Penicillium verhagenii]|uniref:uncharacterized protein n=1 Tax=Penicillium verhagenii TaxID=1562060 RepID=UPI0025455CC8|nr:uncharacterized protein N7466_011250 [Penicillium verhagenii]KAJ5917696.1 hypothetical protein N7466_011250 [Penicillium verhagenii]